MKIGVLTSSRADYSIYYPLLCALQGDPDFDLEILVFGTHLSKRHGLTINQIRKDGFSIAFELATAPTDDTPAAISNSMANTIIGFSSVWKESKYDLVFCLGDRYEMFAACASSVPFNIKLAHIHGGEETLGAIDNVFRHSITHMAALHFTAAEPYYDRVKCLVGAKDNVVFNTGALSIDNLRNLTLLSVEEFLKTFQIDLRKPSILITFHPETMSFEKNEFYINQLVSALQEIRGYQFVITTPNADTSGNLIREKLRSFIESTPDAYMVESLGTVGYLSCMKHCSFLLGNTSSGFIEAAYFPKYVINLGDRQKGRIQTANINTCPVLKDEILKAVEKFKEFQLPSRVQMYGDGNAAIRIKNILKSKYD